MTKCIAQQSNPLHIALRPDLIGSADIAADALTAAVTAFLDHIISEAVCN